MVGDDGVVEGVATLPYLVFKKVFSYFLFISVPRRPRQPMCVRWSSSVMLLPSLASILRKMPQTFFPAKAAEGAKNSELEPRGITECKKTHCTSDIFKRNFASITGAISAPAGRRKPKQDD